jgi:hypothetical protein
MWEFKSYITRGNPIFAIKNERVLVEANLCQVSLSLINRHRHCEQSEAIQSTSQLDCFALLAMTPMG